MVNPAQQFSQLWEELGATHDSLTEEELITKESQLFELKNELSLSDVPYIFNHTDSSRMIRKELMHFLATPTT